ncbi:MAG: TatD family hydrolase [Verrucomicrobia bacterium]|nr:TatD family hydrolase [Verrucomicrobiota bacterium]
MYIDSHAHLSSTQVLPHIEAVMQRARNAKVDRIVNICTDPETLKSGLELASQYSEIRNAGSTTPHDVGTEGEMAFPLFEEAAKSGKLVAVGETGLDYHYEHSPKETQQRFLNRYLLLALECNLPVIFHCRDAFEDLFAITDECYKGSPAVLHCFTGTPEEAEGVFSRGWHLSFSGILTFKKSQSLRDIAQMAPLSQILIETDTPYLAPQKYRGQQNEPSFILETAACLAQAKGISVEEIAIATSQNARKFFRM